MRIVAGAQVILMRRVLPNGVHVIEAGAVQIDDGGAGHIRRIDGC